VQRLFTDQPVRVKVRCAAACDVRAHVQSGSFIAAGVGASAVRRGRSILVRWRTAFPARQVRFFVAPARKPPTKPGEPPFDFRALGFVEGHGRTRFTLRLRPEHPDAARRLVITASDREGGGNRKVTVRVTR
jgi:hypothetical protein